MKKIFVFLLFAIVLTSTFIGCSSKSDESEDWEISYIPYNDMQDFADKVENAVGNKFGIENFTLKEIMVDTVDSPKHQDSRMVIIGVLGDSGERWSKALRITYKQFQTLYDSKNPHVVFDVEENVCNGDLGLICAIIEHYEE